MKHFVLIFIFAFVFLKAQGQEFQLEHIGEHTVDTLLASNRYYDLNGNIASIVILSFNETVRNLSIRGNALAMKSIQGDSTYIVYLADRSKRLILQHEEFYPFVIDFQEHGLIVKGGHSYMVSVNAKNRATAPKQGVTGSQYLIFKSEDEIRKLTVNGETWAVVDKRATKLVPLGLYKYVAESGEGKIVKGEIDLKSKTTSKVVNIVFKE